MTGTDDTVYKPLIADEARMAAAEYWREQRAAVGRIAKLKQARLAQAKSAPQKPKRKKRVPAHRKTEGFGRWS
jgi:hypothetical protein